MRFHYQNLNEKRGVDRYGSILRHGRCWWGGWHWEWNLFKSTSVGITFDLADYEDDAFGGHIAIGFAAFYWGWGNRRLRKWAARITARDKTPRTVMANDGRTMTYWMSNGRTMGIQFFDGTLWINLWNDPMESRSVDPWWWHISINLRDLILGRAVYRDGEPYESARVLIPMPEGGYWARVDLKSETWTRPRWKTKTLNRAHIEMEEGQAIPFPGKGENSWDCGEDATFSFTCCADTVLEGVMALTRSVMERRIRYGGVNWLPEAKKVS